MIKTLYVFLFCLGASMHCSGQMRKQNGPGHLFVDIGGGSTNAVEPYSVGYRSATFGVFHANLGVRYMMNSRFGYRLQAGYDQIRNAPNGLSLPFETTYYRGSGQIIVNLGEILNFEDFTYVVGLLFHIGGGYARLSGSGKTSGMAHVLNGFMITGKLSRRFQLFFDVTRVNSVYQQIKFDMQNSHNEKGFDGMILNLSLGLSVNFGKS